jgi:CHAD domain-containing protein
LVDLSDIDVCLGKIESMDTSLSEFENYTSQILTQLTEMEATAIDLGMVEEATKLSNGRLEILSLLEDKQAKSYIEFSEKFRNELETLHKRVTVEIMVNELQKYIENCHKMRNELQMEIQKTNDEWEEIKKQLPFKL